MAPGWLANESFSSATTVLPLLWLLWPPGWLADEVCHTGGGSSSGSLFFCLLVTGVNRCQMRMQEGFLVTRLIGNHNLITKTIACTRNNDNENDNENDNDCSFRLFSWLVVQLFAHLFWLVCPFVCPFVCSFTCSDVSNLWDWQTHLTDCVFVCKDAEEMQN